MEEFPRSSKLLHFPHPVDSFVQVCDDDEEEERRDPVV